LVFGSGLRLLLFGGGLRHCCCCLVVSPGWLAHRRRLFALVLAVCAVLAAAVFHCVVVIGAAQAAATWFLAVVCACCCSAVVCDTAAVRRWFATMSARSGLRSSTTTADLDDGSSIDYNRPRNNNNPVRRYRMRTVDDGSCAFYAITDTPDKPVGDGVVHRLRLAALKTINLFWGVKGRQVPFATALSPAERQNDLTLGAILRAAFEVQDWAELPPLSEDQALEIANLSARVDRADVEFQRRFSAAMADPSVYVGVTELSAAAFSAGLEVYVFNAADRDAFGWPQLANPGWPLGRRGGRTVCVLHGANGQAHFEKFAVPAHDLHYELTRARAIKSFVAQSSRARRGIPSCAKCPPGVSTVKLSSGQVVCPTCFKASTGFPTHEPTTYEERRALVEDCEESDLSQSDELSSDEESPSDDADEGEPKPKPKAKAKAKAKAKVAPTAQPTAKPVAQPAAKPTAQPNEMPVLSMTLAGIDHTISGFSKFSSRRRFVGFVAKKQTRWWGLKFKIDDEWVSSSDVDKGLQPLVDRYKATIAHDTGDALFWTVRV
jgi:cell division septation protein DedD